MNRLHNIFFVFGPAKSGTTFLQRLLNAHPSVSCPTEHHFGILKNHLDSTFANYNQHLLGVDRRTGGQGPSLYNDQDAIELFRFAIIRAIFTASGDKKICGANDNEVMHNLQFYNSIFPSPKFIAIFRDPRETAISSWHHNLETLKEKFTEKIKSFEEWCIQCTKWWKADVDDVTHFSSNNDNMFIVKFEDLVGHKKSTSLRLFSYLDASCEEEIIERIIEESSFDKMKKNSTNQTFFRKGETDTWKKEMDTDLIREVQDICFDQLKYFNYEIV